MMNHHLPRNFFARPTVQVAQELIGKKLVFNQFAGIITETEAYVGSDDPACHAARGLTPRTKPMFGPAGTSYVYFIYGMYHCLNIVTEKKDFPAAVLIRGLQLTHPQSLLLNGPGKLCRHLGVTREHNEIDLVDNPNFYIEDISCVLPFKATPRIGIKVGLDRMWRFVALEFP